VSSLELGSVTIQARLGSARLLYKLDSARLDYCTSSTRLGSFYRPTCNVLLAFSQSYVEHDLRKTKIVVPFFANRLIFIS
jgi:hypothetical protein